MGFTELYAELTPNEDGQQRVAIQNLTTSNVSLLTASLQNYLTKEAKHCSKLSVNAIACKNELCSNVFQSQIKEGNRRIEELKKMISALKKVS